MKPIENCLESIKVAITTSSRDNSAYGRDAWVYGIVVGWDEALLDVAKQHRWDEETVARLQRLRQQFIELENSITADQGEQDVRP